MKPILAEHSAHMLEPAPVTGVTVRPDGGLFHIAQPDGEVLTERLLVAAHVEPFVTLSDKFGEFGTGIRLGPRAALDRRAIDRQLRLPVAVVFRFVDGTLALGFAGFPFLT